MTPPRPELDKARSAGQTPRRVEATRERVVRRSIHTLYWNNIDPALVAAQARAMAALGFEVQQHDRTGMGHGAWMEEILAAAEVDELVLFLDIDCIATTAEAVERAFAAAAMGHIYGIAQQANHAPGTGLYAGPPFLACARATWEQAGRPSLSADATHDVGGRLTTAAVGHGIAVDYIYPTFVGFPRWALAGGGCFGIATLYETGVFHLFESRNGRYVPTFQYVADCVARSRPVDYLEVSRMVLKGARREAMMTFPKRTLLRLLGR